MWLFLHWEEVIDLFNNVSPLNNISFTTPLSVFCLTYDQQNLEVLLSGVGGLPYICHYTVGEMMVLMNGHKTLK